VARAAVCGGKLFINTLRASITYNVNPPSHTLAR
jgi:hypothetical protein